MPNGPEKQQSKNVQGRGFFPVLGGVNKEESISGHDQQQ
ncbi:hypothetical protein FPSE_03145 [Fusarium pseudograminearum CS3096]|uniref:Uncharacterized protein n=1 Tax=Fusarium pseudograminearum (strain CS3096) TaxID=1028729 RepID=K3VPB6_FUSPC|nr:hypothetical protein FPSE_03145 [Fusarium pseudograminearum CS3096]EKJ76734.1 hypothetical protein FPSE_03145 [Fusarium pseudograminearum CS3096]